MSINITGRIIYNENHYNEEIDLSGYPKGVYFIRIKIGKEVFVEKLVLQ